MTYRRCLSSVKLIFRGLKVSTVARAHMSSDPGRTLRSVLIVQIEVAMMLAAAGIRHCIVAEPQVLRRKAAVVAALSFSLIAGAIFVVSVVDTFRATLQRNRDLTMLKALGASRLYLINIFVQQSLLIAISGTILGIATTYVLRRMAVSSLSVGVAYSWWPLACAFSTLGALLGMMLAFAGINLQDAAQVLSGKE